MHEWHSTRRAATARTPKVPQALPGCTRTRHLHHGPDTGRGCYGSPELLGSHVRSARRSRDLVCKLLCKVPCGRRLVNGVHTVVICAPAQGCGGQSWPHGVAAWIVQGGCRAWQLERADAPASELIQHLGARAECLASAVTDHQPLQPVHTRKPMSLSQYTGGLSCTAHASGVRCGPWTCA